MPRSLQHAPRSDPHPGRTRQAQGRARFPRRRQAAGGRGAHQGGARVRGHHRELGVRRRQERAGDARAADRPARGQAALGAGHRRQGCDHRRRRRRHDRPRQGPEDRQVPAVHDRRFRRGESRGEQALERVAGGPRADGPQAQRPRVGAGAQGPGPQAQDHEDRPRPVEPRLVDEPSDLLAARRAKLERLRAEGIDPFPHSYPGVVSAASVAEAHAELGEGEETDARYRVAGRLAARRGQGKMAFLDLVDRTGRIQLQARVDELGEQRMELLLGLDLGDIIGVDGVAFRTKRGELSLRVEDFAVLAKSLRPPPEKFHGLTDVETRLRRRELDLMANEETREVFLARARIITAVRGYLDTSGFVEVETPVLQPLYGGALARPFVTHFNALDQNMYLRIATELYLKRCIVGGLERVYEIGKDFRNEGLSPKHNPEFTMVEWYEAYADYTDAMRRLEACVAFVAQQIGYQGELNFGGPWRCVTMRDAIREETGIDIGELRERDALAAAIEEKAGHIHVEDSTWPQLVDALVSKAVEPKLIQPTFIIDYPKELSPFAKDHRSEPGLVERFEAFVNGMEIANAFTELNDPDEQRARFEAQLRYSEEGDEETQPYDESYVEALEHGMPPTGGLGLGIDRLTMVMTGKSTIRDVVLFPALRE